MSTESSSSKEDMPFPRERSGSSSSCFTPLKRTPRVPLCDNDDHNLQNENEDIYNQNLDYPVCDYIDKFYVDFQKRNRFQRTNVNSDIILQSSENKINEFCNNQNFNYNHSFCYSIPKVPTETIQIPKQVNLRIGKVIVLLADLTALNLNGKKVQSKYIHSWKNISKIANVEANKFLEKFFTRSYQKIVNSKNNEALNHKQNMNIPSAKSKSANIYQIGLQYNVQNSGNLLSPKQPKISPNSSSFGTPCPPGVKVLVHWTNDVPRGVFSKPTQLNSSIRIFHYVGLGLSPPTEDSLYTIDYKDQKSTKMMISELNIVPPSLSIFDCDKAAILLDYFKEHDSNVNAGADKSLFSAFFATSKGEQLRIPSDMPQNLFSCILLSPTHAFSKITNIPVEDRMMFRTLLTIFTESIGLDSLPTETFYSIFRGDPVVSTLWQNFFLAQRLMHKYGLQSQSYPELRDMSEHQLWYQFEYAMMTSATFSNQTNVSKKQSRSNIYSSSKDDNDNDNSSSNISSNNLNDSSNDEYEPDNESSSNLSNFVADVKRMNSMNYTSSVFLSSNPIYNLSNMYCISFDTLENPPSYVTAFIASLIIVQNLRSDIMARIARFMSKSPQNCITMGKVLNFSVLCQYVPDTEDNEDFYVDWCCVMSGLLLAVPSLASLFVNIESNRFIKICLRIAKNQSKRNMRSFRDPNLSLMNDGDEKVESSPGEIMKKNKLLGNINNFDVSEDESLSVFDSFDKYCDAICVYLLSILVAIRDCPGSPNCFVNSSLIKQFLLCFFTSNPILREWMVIFFHSALTRNRLFLDEIGTMGLQSLTVLLLFEKRIFTRAASITLLTSVMNESRSSLFNHTLMNCALKAAIDGSHIVRHNFLLFAAFYLQLSGRKLLEERDDEYEIKPDENVDTIPLSNDTINDNDDDDDDDENGSNYNEFNLSTKGQYCSMYVKVNDEDKIINSILDDFIKNDSEKFCNESKCFQGIPKLKKLIQFLQKDPYKENSDLATEILNNTSSVSPLSRCQSYAVQIHRMAHTLLFSQRVDEKYSIHQRYCDNVFEDNILEQFELIEINSGPIHAIAFDYDHKTFCTASLKGELVWGENHWKLGENVFIESICPLRGLAWAVMSNEGIVYILKDGQEEPVDKFRPSMREVHRPNIDLNALCNEYLNGQPSKENNANSSDGNKISLDYCKGILCSSPLSPIVFISQGNNEILAWDVEALLLVGRMDVEAPPKFMTIINGRLYIALVNGVILQIGLKNGSLDKQQFGSNVSFSPPNSSTSSISQQQQQNSNNQAQNENETFSDNECYDYNYDEIDDSDSYDNLLENVYTSGDELIMYVKKRNEKFKDQNLLRIGNHKGLLYTALDKGPLYFWEDFEFPKQITDELDISQSEFLVHPLYPIALILNVNPYLIQLYEDAPILLSKNSNHKCSCCCFDGERPLCAIGYKDGSVGVWRIKKIDDNENEKNC